MGSSPHPTYTTFLDREGEGNYATGTDGIHRAYMQLNRMPPAKPEDEETFKYVTALAEMSHADLTMYRRTKWIVDNIRAAGASDRITEIKMRATSIYFDYAARMHRPHLEQFLTGEISMHHFATILRGQLVPMEQHTRMSTAKGRRHSGRRSGTAI